MSLIIAHKVQNNCQIWCGDGLVIEAEHNRQYAVSNAIDKIYQMVPNTVAIGFSGNCYDAAEILRLAAYNHHIFSIEHLANDLAQIVAQVNMSSERIRHSRGIPREKTGIIVGGFLRGTSFLFIIGPEGQIVYAPSYAVIGAGLFVIDGGAIKSLMTCKRVKDSIAIQRKLFKIAALSNVVDGVRQIVTITPNRVTNCNGLKTAHRSMVALDSIISDNQEEQTKCQVLR